MSNYHSGVPLNEDETTTRRPRWSRTVAALLMAGQGLILAVLGVVQLIRTAIDGGSDVGRSVTFDVLLIVFAVGALGIGLALWRGAAAARTPTVLWNVFAVLVGTTLARGGAQPLGIAAIVLGLVTLGMGLVAPLDNGRRDSPAA